MMSTLYPPSSEGGGSLASSAPSSPAVLIASNTPNMSRSSSYSGQESRPLSFRGQSVKIILPDTATETTSSIEDIISRMVDIHEFDEEEACDEQYLLTVDRRGYQ
jgi:hypothetical protein